MKKVKKSKNEWEYFDDCGICQAMEEVDKKGKSLSLEELKSAYKDRIFSEEDIKELMEDKEKPHMFYRIRPNKFVLFDAVNFGDNWRQEYNL